MLMLIKFAKIAIIDVLVVMKVIYALSVEGPIEMISVVVFVIVTMDIMMMTVIIKIVNLVIISVTPVESILFVKLVRGKIETI
jgi:hypothetical protein